MERGGRVSENRRSKGVRLKEIETLPSDPTFIKNFCLFILYPIAFPLNAPSGSIFRAVIIEMNL
jgi:hypothetical protein